MAPGIEVYGLKSGSFDRQPVRGKSGVAMPTREGGLVWAGVVTSKNAGAIRLHVEDMSLPGNMELYLYSRNGQAYGPYTGAGPHDTGEFWTATIFGSEAILQLHVSSAATKLDLRGASFRVLEAGLITPRFAGSLQNSSHAPVAQAPPQPGWPCGNPNCVVDATCVGGIANSLKLAVAKMEWIQGAFIYTCTGGLISDNNPSQNNFFLTANHCISKNNSAKNVNLYWRFATSSCNGSSCPSNSGWPYQTSGATVSKTGRKGDFSLLHLNSAPPSGSVTLGWTTTPVANSNNTDLYRVSNPNFGPQVYSQHRVDTSAPTCSSWPRGERIYSRDITGAIDGGSSGSPIVNGSSQIVGQLSGTCGLNPSSPCSSGPGEDNATVDGAFAFYYATVQPVLNP
ncbi:serine protease [bacterium]|nr:serine protease [bacterium]